MVYIKYNISIFVYAPVNYLFYTVHPCRVDIEVRVCMGIPGDRYADSAETLRFYCIYQRLCGLWIAPVCLSAKTKTLVICAVMGIECVAQVPAHAHICGDLNGCHF